MFLAGFISTAEFSETVVEFCDIRKLNKSNLSFSLTLKIPLKPRVIIGNLEKPRYNLLAWGWRWNASNYIAANPTIKTEIINEDRAGVFIYIFYCEVFENMLQ